MEMPAVDLILSPGYRARYPGVPFGLTLVSGCKNQPNPEGFDHYKRKLLRKMRRRETLAEITFRIETYDRFFQSFGHECPLTKHLKRPSTAVFPDMTSWWMPISWLRCVRGSWLLSRILTVLREG